MKRQKILRLSLQVMMGVLIMTSLISGVAQAKPSFEQWLAGFKRNAAAEGVSTRTLQNALSDLTPNQRVIELDRNQPDKKWTFAAYQEMVVNPARIKKGRKLYQEHYSLLKRVEQTYGVPAQFIVALWGIESNFGENTGGFDVIRSLATLAWDGRREELFTTELMLALKIIDQGHITRAKMIGSWAGAMGQCQFMPSSFLKFAQDENGDGRRDIWGTKADVFASAANYLAKSGWKSDEIWGRRVMLPRGFDKALISLDVKKPLAEWQRLGLKLPGGAAIPVVEGMSASVVAPDGLDGAAFLVYDNYRIIMTWNRSTYFATSVGLLANAIAQ